MRCTEKVQFFSNHMPLVTLVATSLLFLSTSCLPAEKKDGNKDPAVMQTPSPYPNSQPGYQNAVQSPTINDANLPPYLLTFAQAQAINPIVLPQVNTQELPAPSVQRLTQYEGGINSFISRLFTSPVLAPRRDVTAYLLASAIPDAFAGVRSVYLNLGVTHFSPEQTMTILCHELAHIVRNHVSNPLPRPSENYVNLLNQYLQNTYNSRTQIYRHDAASFAAIKASIQQEATPRYQVMKRAEAEADVIGGHICAAAGMTADQYVSNKSSALQAIVALLGQAAFPTEPPNGAMMQIPSSELMEALESFAGFDSHPTNEERILQLQVVKPLYRPSTPNIVGDWSSMYLQIKQQTATLLANLRAQQRLALAGDISEFRPRRSCLFQHVEP